MGGGAGAGDAGGADRPRRRDPRRRRQHHGRGRERAAGDGADRGAADLAVDQEGASLSVRGDCLRLFGREAVAAARPRASFRLVRRARQMGAAGGDLGHAPARIAAGRAAAHPGDDDAAADRGPEADIGGRADGDHLRAVERERPSAGGSSRCGHRALCGVAARAAGAGRRADRGCRGGAVDPRPARRGPRGGNRGQVRVPVPSRGS